MAILENALEEEYQRSLRVSRALEREVARLPKGSIRTKRINGHNYYYLQYRDGSHVRSKYVKASELDEVREELAQRKAHVEALKEQEESRKMIVRALGRVPE